MEEPTPEVASTKRCSARKVKTDKDPKKMDISGAAVEMTGKGIR